MRKTNVLTVIALMLAVLTGLTLNQVNGVSAQGDSPVGMVAAYTPGVSITIVDEKGNQIEYALDATVKIEPPGADKSLKVGSVVTIIAPVSINKGKQIAVGIVVHPEKELVPSQTPLVKNTALPTDHPMTATPKVTETPAPVESATATPSPGANPAEDGTAVKSNSFIAWLRSLFQQVLSNQ